MGSGRRPPVCSLGRFGSAWLDTEKAKTSSVQRTLFEWMAIHTVTEGTLSPPPMRSEEDCTTRATKWRSSHAHSALAINLEQKRTRRLEQIADPDARRARMLGRHGRSLVPAAALGPRLHLAFNWPLATYPYCMRATTRTYATRFANIGARPKDASRWAAPHSILRGSRRRKGEPAESP
jgi:hypothetical protein